MERNQKATSSHLVNHNYIHEVLRFTRKYIAPGTGVGARNNFTTLAVGMVVLKPHY